MGVTDTIKNRMNRKQSLVIEKLPEHTSLLFPKIIKTFFITGNLNF